MTLIAPVSTSVKSQKATLGTDHSGDILPIWLQANLSAKTSHIQQLTGKGVVVP